MASQLMFQQTGFARAGRRANLHLDKNGVPITTVDRFGNLTAQKAGQGNAQSAIDAFIRGQQPLLGVAGAGALAAPFAYGAAQQQPFPPAPGPVQWQ